MFKLIGALRRDWFTDSPRIGSSQPNVPLERTPSRQSVVQPEHVEQPVADKSGKDLTAFVDGFKSISKGDISKILSSEQKDKLSALEGKINDGKTLSDQDVADIKDIVGALTSHLKNEKSKEIAGTTKRFFGMSNKPLATLLTDRAKLQEDLKNSTNPAEKEVLKAKLDKINDAMTSKFMRKGDIDTRYTGDGYVKTNKAVLTDALNGSLDRDKDGAVAQGLLSTKATFGSVLKSILGKKPDDTRTQIEVARHPNLEDDTRRQLGALNKPAVTLALEGFQPQAVLWLGKQRAGKDSLDQGLQGKKPDDDELMQQRINLQLAGLAMDVDLDAGPPQTSMLVKLGLDNSHFLPGLAAELDMANSPGKLEKFKGDLKGLTDGLIGNLDKRAKAYEDMGLSPKAAEFLKLQRDKVKTTDPDGLKALQDKDAALLEALGKEVTAGTLSATELKLLQGVQQAVDNDVPELQKLATTAKTKVATGLDVPVSLKPLDARIDLSTCKFEKNLGEASGVERTFFIKGQDGTLMIAKKSSEDKMMVHERLGHVMGALLGIPANKVQVGKFDVDGSEETVSVHHLVGKNPQGFWRVAKDCGLDDSVSLDFRHPDMLISVGKYSPPSGGPSSWNVDDGGQRYAKLKERVTNPEVFDQIHFFDRIVDNQDRHANNYLASDAGKNSKGDQMYEVSLIDHGRSFGWSEPLDPAARKKEFSGYLDTLTQDGNKTHLANVKTQLERFAALTDDQLGKEFLSGVDDKLSDRQKQFIPDMLKAKRDAAKEWLEANRGLLA